MAPAAPAHAGTPGLAGQDRPPRYGGRPDGRATLLRDEGGAGDGHVQYAGNVLRHPVIRGHAAVNAQLRLLRQLCCGGGSRGANEQKAQKLEM